MSEDDSAEQMTGAEKAFWDLLSGNYLWHCAYMFLYLIYLYGDFYPKSISSALTFYLDSDEREMV